MEDLTLALRLVEETSNVLRSPDCEHLSSSLFRVLLTEWIYQTPSVSLQ